MIGYFAGNQQKIPPEGTFEDEKLPFQWRVYLGMGNPDSDHLTC